MPPSIPPHGGANDSSTGVATTRLPLLRETTGNPKNSVNKSASSGSAIGQTQRRISETINPDTTRNRPLRNNRKNVIIRKNKSKAEKASSSTLRGHNTINAENDCDNASDVHSSLDPLPAATNLPMDSTGLAPYGGVSNVSPYGFYGGAASMMSPSPYYGMGMNTMGMTYMSGLNQMVFNVQNIIFSITQAIHMVGANQEALRQAWESLNQMVDHAVVTFHEMRALEIMEREHETEEEREKRKRLKALRYAFVFGGSWLAYKLIRNILFRKRGLQRYQQRQSAPALYGSNYHGQYGFDGMSTSYPGAAFMSNNSSPNNFYAGMNMGQTGYSGFENGYY